MKMSSHPENPDIKIIENFYAADERGSFTKIFNSELYESFHINTEIREEFYSISAKNAIRGIHFQTPPNGHDKLVHVIKGSVLDVAVDLRKSSKYYKKYVMLFLKGEKPQTVYIPQGFAHGFKSLEEGTIMLYNVSAGYVKEADAGIRWDSIGLDWGVEAPVVSERDKSFPTLEEFESPF